MATALMNNPCYLQFDGSILQQYVLFQYILSKSVASAAISCPNCILRILLNVFQFRVTTLPSAFITAAIRTRRLTRMHPEWFFFLHKEPGFLLLHYLREPKKPRSPPIGPPITHPILRQSICQNVPCV